MFSLALLKTLDTTMPMVQFVDVLTEGLGEDDVHFKQLMLKVSQSLGRKKAMQLLALTLRIYALQLLPNTLGGLYVKVVRKAVKGAQYNWIFKSRRGKKAAVTLDAIRYPTKFPT